MRSQDEFPLALVDPSDPHAQRSAAEGDQGSTGPAPGHRPSGKYPIRGSWAAIRRLSPTGYSNWSRDSTRGSARRFTGQTTGTKRASRWSRQACVRRYDFNSSKSALRHTALKQPCTQNYFHPPCQPEYAPRSPMAVPLQPSHASLQFHIRLRDDSFVQ